MFCLGPPFIKFWGRDSKGEKKFGLWDKCYQMLSLAALRQREAGEEGKRKRACHFWINFHNTTWTPFFHSIISFFLLFTQPFPALCLLCLHPLQPGAKPSLKWHWIPLQNKRSMLLWVDQQVDSRFITACQHWQGMLQIIYSFFSSQTLLYLNWGVFSPSGWSGKCYFHHYCRSVCPVTSPLFMWLVVKATLESKGSCSEAHCCPHNNWGGTCLRLLPFHSKLDDDARV